MRCKGLHRGLTKSFEIGIHSLSRVTTRSKEVQQGAPSCFLMQPNPCTEDHATAAERVAHLRARGLQIKRPKVAARKIEEIGYERLRINYLSRDHTQPDRPFRPGTTCNHILRLHRCDTKMREIRFMGVWRFEFKATARKTTFRSSGSSIPSLGGDACPRDSSGLLAISIGPPASSMLKSPHSLWRILQSPKSLAETLSISGHSGGSVPASGSFISAVMLQAVDLADALHVILCHLLNDNR